MCKSHRQPNGRTNLASCIVSTIFLIFVVIVVFIVYFTVFKPKNPEITVNAIQLPTFSVGNGTVNFTFSQYVSVKNPNREVFTHYDSSIQLLYSGTQLGLRYVPAGKIEAGQTQCMVATFSVMLFPLSQNAGPTITDGLNGFRVGATMEIESKVEMAGRVRVLHFFTHHVDATAHCRSAISDLSTGMHLLQSKCEDGIYYMLQSTYVLCKPPTDICWYLQIS